MRAALLLLLLAGPVLADVVHLTTGRAVTGKVVKEDEEKVVVKTPDGTLTFPRHLVERIERQGQGETKIAMARERIRAGDFDAAFRLLEEATKDPDPEVAKKATKELESARAQEERARKLDPKPKDPLPLPEGTKGTPVAGSTLQTQFDRARRAIEDGDHVSAIRLLRPMVADNPEDRVLRYLLGRALELASREQEARAEYVRVLGPKWESSPRPLPHLGEVARRQLAGDQLKNDSPGVGARWQRVETKSFAVYHPFERVESWLVDEMDRALEEVSAKLEVPLHELAFRGRIQVFLFPTREDYELSTGMKLAGGHANAQVAPDGTLYSIAAFPTKDFYRTSLRHEVAHVVLYEVAPGLPAWAHEGAATFAEPVDVRARHRRTVHGRRTAGQLPALLEFMAGAVPRGEDRDAVAGYYGQANVLFDVLNLRLGGPRRALKLCQRVAQDGPQKALEAFKLSAADLEADLGRVAADSTSTE